MTATNCVCLVEDDAQILGMLDEILTEAHFTVLVASTGAKALALLTSDAIRCRAIITDIRLGVGPNGWDVADWARGIVVDMPVVYMSGDSAADWRARGVIDSCMLAKPFTPDQMLAALSRMIASTEIRRLGAALH